MQTEHNHKYKDMAWNKEMQILVKDMSRMQSIKGKTQMDENRSVMRDERVGNMQNAVHRSMQQNYSVWHGIWYGGTSTYVIVVEGVL